MTENCPTFQGPLDIDCLTSIWLDVGCTRNGERLPARLDKAQKQEEWKEFNLQYNFFMIANLDLCINIFEDDLQRRSLQIDQLSRD